MDLEWDRADWLKNLSAGDHVLVSGGKSLLVEGTVKQILHGMLVITIPNSSKQFYFKADTGREDSKAARQLQPIEI